MKKKALKTTALALTAACFYFGHMGMSFAETEPKPKAKKISFKSCCSENNYDTKKCRKMKNVRGKRVKKGEKWFKRKCVDPAKKAAKNKRIQKISEKTKKKNLKTN